ncbi:MAG: prolyl oligopeptidase family serine peptidase [Armatimonadetes bacterium]|nr:prolyl oligopeptidase family serine peptidase [Armatimonadota bacterium]
MKSFSIPCMFLAGFAFGQTTNPLETEAYLTPPKEIASYFDLPRYKQFTLSNLNSSRTWFARVKSRGQVLLSDLANPYENMAGWMIDCHANRARTMSYRTGESIVLTNAATFEEREIKPPTGAWVSNPSWSPDGRTLMFLAHTPDASTIFLHDVGRDKTWQLTSHALLATRVSPEWVGNSKSIIGVFVPSNRGPEPVAGPVAAQPKVQVTNKDSNRLRTYRSLLQSDLDKKRLEFFITGQLEVVDIAKGGEKKIGLPSMISSIDSAPTADFFRVTTVEKPFSYLVPASEFGTTEGIWDTTGKVLTVLDSNKMQEGNPAPPPPGTPPASREQAPRRQMMWAPDGNGLVYVRTANAGSKTDEVFGSEASQRRRGGQVGAAQESTKEELVRWSPPFRPEDVKVLYTSEKGFSNLDFSPDGKKIYFTESTNGTTTEVEVGLADSAKKNLWNWKTANPLELAGDPVLTPNQFGVRTLDLSPGFVLLQGTHTGRNAEKEPPRPFLDSFDVASGKVNHVWESAESAFEAIDGIVSPDGSKLVIDHQSPTEISNNFLFENGKMGRQITQNTDLAPDLTGAKKYRLQVTRADGIKFWVNVSTPDWYVEGQKLPAFFWFYPREYDDQAAYDRSAVVRNKNLFPNLGNSPKELLLRRGWALVEPDCPIIGPRERVNDFYVNDLRNNLSATIDLLDAKGLIDRTKLAIGGHSYGGFSTANALVHTPFFKAGIAGAGNYNRTLTPLAFQSERRTLFEAPNTYMEMSSLLHAENMTGALLMYCGMEDQNVGTDPINSIRMFNVLESIGKPAALYMYPYEDHGQIARESLMDQWARWIPWLDKYVLGK